MQPVPELFQADDVASRVVQLEWLQNNLGLNDRFFAAVLDVDPKLFHLWHTQKVLPSPKAMAKLENLWGLFLHLLSLVNFDTSVAKELLETGSNKAATPNMSTAALPWEGRSMQSFLEANGSQGVELANYWLTSMRFVDLTFSGSGARQWQASFTPQP